MMRGRGVRPPPLSGPPFSSSSDPADHFDADGGDTSDAIDGERKRGQARAYLIRLEEAREWMAQCLGPLNLPDKDW